jgi:spermidine synthase
MTRRWGTLPITGVERDPEVVRLARTEFGLDQLTNLTIVTADAFAWMRRLSWTFGAICVDLYVAGAMAHGVVGGPFLRDTRRALAPDGEVTFNLWRSARLEDQTRRIGAYFRIAAVETVDDNVIVRATHPMER